MSFLLFPQLASYGMLGTMEAFMLTPPPPVPVSFPLHYEEEENQNHDWPGVLPSPWQEYDCLSSSSVSDPHKACGSGHLSRGL